MADSKPFFGIKQMFCPLKHEVQGRNMEKAGAILSFNERKARIMAAGGMMIAVHENEVLRMMLLSGDVYTKAELRAAILEKFGEEARFYTCSTQNMDCEALI